MTQFLTLSKFHFISLHILLTILIALSQKSHYKINYIP